MQEPILIHQVRFAQMLLHKNLEGVTPEQSLVDPERGGNSLNWVVGHICLARNGMLKVLRGSGHLPDEALAIYSSKGQYSKASALGLGMLVTHHMAMQQPLIDGLRNLSAEQFAATAPYSPVGDPDETVGSLLTKGIAHEIYHAGQAGILRRLLGLKGAIGRA